MLQEDAVVPATTVGVRTGDGQQNDLVLRSASRFGAFRARQELVLAMKLGRHSMSSLHDANPARTFVRSTIDRFDESTRDLPGRGVLPLDPDAPLLYVREAMWLLVGLLLAVYLMLLSMGVHPIVALVERLA